MRIEFTEGLFQMTDKRDGSFSANLMSLQLQLKTLLDGTGGDAAIQMLDTLGSLNPSEQKIALGIFSRVLENIRSGAQRLETADDRVLKEFEEGLYRDILSSMREAANDSEPRRIEVIDGGKTRRPADKSPIDLDQVRKNRRAKHKHLLN